MGHPDEQAEQIRQEIEEETWESEKVQASLKKLQEIEAREKKYPECTKLSKIREERLSIEEFLEWAAVGGIELCSPMPGGGGRYYPMNITRERLLLKYFRIDEKKLEEERRALLEEQRKLNEK